MRRDSGDAALMRQYLQGMHSPFCGAVAPRDAQNHPLGRAGQPRISRKQARQHPVAALPPGKDGLIPVKCPFQLLYLCLPHHLW